MANKNERRRGRIFHKYSSHLKVLEKYKLLPDDIELDNGHTYICPICTDFFYPEDLNQKLENPLTLEDVPPKSLGGRANVLTCRNCNNTCGHQIDYQLNIAMIAKDEHEFVPNKKGDAKFIINSNIVGGRYEVKENGDIIVKHDIKHNNPKVLEQSMKDIEEGIKEIQLQHPDRNLNKHYIELALLKTAYLMVFEKFGYDFILSNTYDIIREQLLDIDYQPDNKGYFYHRLTDDFPYERGVYIHKEKRSRSSRNKKGKKTATQRGILSIFDLVTENTTRTYCVFLPFPNSSINAIKNEALENLGQGMELHGWIKEHNLLHNPKNIKGLIKFLR